MGNSVTQGIGDAVPICRAKTSNGARCTRQVSPGAKECWQHAHGWARRWKSLTRNQTVGFVIGILLGVSGVTVSVLAWEYPDFWKSPHQAAPSPAVPRPTLLSLFKSDFPNVMKLEDEDRIVIQWKNGEALHIKTQVYADFPAKSQFVGFYIPGSPTTFEACMALADAVQSTIAAMQKHVGIRAGYRDEANTLNELTFSGRVLLYHEAPLTIVQKANIIQFLRRSPKMTRLYSPKVTQAF